MIRLTSNNLNRYINDINDDDWGTGNHHFYIGTHNEFEALNPDNVINQAISINSDSFDYLLSISQILNYEDINKERIQKKLTLNDFQQRNIKNLKEDLVYYFSSPESLSNYKNIFEEEIKYDFYKDLDS